MTVVLQIVAVAVYLHEKVRPNTTIIQYKQKNEIHRANKVLYKKTSIQNL